MSDFHGDEAMQIDECHALVHDARLECAEDTPRQCEGEARPGYLASLAYYHHGHMGYWWSASTEFQLMKFATGKVRVTFKVFPALRELLPSPFCLPPWQLAACHLPGGGKLL